MPMGWNREGKGQIIRPIPPRQPDLRIERLVVTIVKSQDLNDYFFDRLKMNLACRYVGVPIHSFRYIDDVAKFLDSLYFADPEKFCQFFEYILKEIIEGNQILRVYGQEQFDGFDRFRIEFNILGFDFDIDKWKVIPTVGHTKEDNQIETELEQMLDSFDSKYREMLRGAWHSFLSDNPDRYRQTIISLRELTRMIIQQLAPEEKTRKDRIKKIIVSEKEEELVESLADTIVKLQDLQSNKVHSEPDYDSTLFTLKATEYLLFFLLKKSKN